MIELRKVHAFIDGQIAGHGGVGAVGVPFIQMGGKRPPPPQVPNRTSAAGRVSVPKPFTPQPLAGKMASPMPCSRHSANRFPTCDSAKPRQVGRLFRGERSADAADFRAARIARKPRFHVHDANLRRNSPGACQFQRCRRAVRAGDHHGGVRRRGGVRHLEQHVEKLVRIVVDDDVPRRANMAAPTDTKLAPPPSAPPDTPRRCAAPVEGRLPAPGNMPRCPQTVRRSPATPSHSLPSLPACSTVGCSFSNFFVRQPTSLHSLAKSRPFFPRAPPLTTVTTSRFCVVEEPE